MSVRSERLEVQVGGLTISNPVGLAPGFDKDCEMVDALSRFGFGYLVTGSVMLEPRPGNPRPRIIRYPSQNALGTCVGLPSRGLDYVAERLKRRRRPGLVPLIVNINGFDPAEYIKCVETLQPLTDGLELSLSCSNCPEAGGNLLNLALANTLFSEIARRKEKPVFIKIPAYTPLSDSARQNLFDIVGRAIEYHLDGVTAIVGWTVEEKRLSAGRAALSGSPLFEGTLRMVRDLHELTQGRWTIKARGGIFTGEDAFEAIAAGATTVEVFSAFIYRGWYVAKEINQGLLRLLEERDMSVESLRGSNIRLRRPR